MNYDSNRILILLLYYERRHVWSPSRFYSPMINNDNRSEWSRRKSFNITKPSNVNQRVIAGVVIPDKCFISIVKYETIKNKKI
jgi:hypothetical protein